MKKQPEVTAATRQRIIDAFWEIYRNCRIEQICIKEISNLSHINRTTFYRYFKDIYDILEQEEQRIINEIINVRESFDDNFSFEQTIKKISDIYLKNGEYLCLLTGENGDPAFVGKFKNNLFPAFVTIQHTNQSIQTAIIFDYGITGLLSAFRVWYLSSPRMPVEDFVNLVKNIIMNGIPVNLPTS